MECCCMEAHRLVPHSGLAIKPFKAPFSSFDYVENTFLGCSAIHRCFSLARSFSAQTMVVETIPPVGLIAQENDELGQLGLSSEDKLLCRLSFWNSPIPSEQAINALLDENLIGYVILKRDRAAGRLRTVADHREAATTESLGN